MVHKQQDVFLHVSTPSHFNLVSTAKISGWAELAPFQLSGEALSTILRVGSGGKLVSTSCVQQRDSDRIKVKLSSHGLTQQEKEEATNQILMCLRLNEDYAEFYETCSRFESDFGWVKQFGAGRILRAPSVFEDVVKTICTTNCSWAFSIIMSRNLCTFLGECDGLGKEQRERKSFPTPKAIATAGEAKLREIKMGYRSPYILDLARRVVRGKLDVENLRNGNLNAQQARGQLASIRGLGPYGVSYMLNFLEHFEFLTIDRWMRKKFFEKHTNGRPVPDEEIQDAYEKFGRWKGLFFWVDMTREWLGV